MGPLTAPSGHLPTLAVLLRCCPRDPGVVKGAGAATTKMRVSNAAVAQPGSRPEAVEKLIRARA